MNFSPIHPRLLPPSKRNGSHIGQYLQPFLFLTLLAFHCSEVSITWLRCVFSCKNIFLFTIRNQQKEIFQSAALLYLYVSQPHDLSKVYETIVKPFATIIEINVLEKLPTFKSEWLFFVMFLYINKNWEIYKQCKEKICFMVFVFTIAFDNASLL